MKSDIVPTGPEGLYGTHGRFPGSVQMKREAQAVPVLVRFILVRLTIGFTLGTVSAGAILSINPQVLGGTPGCLETLLFTYALGSVFALGYLGTALCLD